MATSRPWLASYPAGVPGDVDVDAFASLAHLFVWSFERFADRDAFVSFGTRLRYADVDRLSMSFASFLRRDLALVRGERIALVLPNILQFPVALIGALRAGLCVVPTNPLFTAPELHDQLADSGCAAAIVLANRVHVLEAALPGTAVRHVVTTRVGDLLRWPRRSWVNLAVRFKHGARSSQLAGARDFRRALAGGRPSGPREDLPHANDVALVQYTGGTTGKPKGAVLTHGNLIANVEQTVVWVGGTLRPGKETVLTALPLYHTFALMANLLVFMRLGGRNVLLTDPRDMRSFSATLRRSRCTALTGVNTLYKALLDYPGSESALRRAFDSHPLKLAISGGMAVERSVAERWQRTTGIVLTEGYGLTEASPIVTCNRFDAPAFTGKLGLPLPSTEVAIRDEAGREAAPGAVGEIVVRGPQVMREYWNSPRETANAFTADGWLRTGDLGRMDEHGFVEFVDRRKDVIVVSGFKAYPSEIENVVRQHPGVVECAAVGMPDSHSGASVALFVVRRDPTVTASSIEAYCAERLAPYKRPKRIEFREVLPKSALGKPLHRELRGE